MKVKRDPGSFRDRSGYVFHGDDRVFRTINAPALDNYTAARDNGALGSLEEKGWLLPGTELDPSVLDGVEGDVRLVLEHPKLPFVSYPYEWSFPALKAAALLHLDVLLDALAHDVALSDATAYNVQFIGARPVFIDTLSFRPYRKGEFWRGHRQFCEQLLPAIYRYYCRYQFRLFDLSIFAFLHVFYTCHKLAKLSKQTVTNKLITNSYK